MCVDKLMLAMSDVNQIGMTSALFRDDFALAAGRRYRTHCSIRKEGTAAMRLVEFPAITADF